jgi:hypothetical protein
LLGASSYSAIPATFLLQQWGNWPTLLSLWLVTVWAALVALFWHKLTSWPVLAATTIVLTLTMLSYTVTAAYTGLFIGLLVVAGWLLAPRERKKWGAVLLSLVVATSAAVLAFYGQYIGVMLEETLPTFGNAINEQGSLTTLRPTFGAFISGTILKAMQSYNLAIVYTLAFAGALWVLFRRRGGKSVGYITLARPRPAAAYGLVATPYAARQRSVDWRKVWLGAWLLTFPAFTLLDYWVDQALKEFWYALPAIAVVGGIWLFTLGTRSSISRAYARLSWLIWALLVWQSLSLWIFRLLFHNR